MTNNKIGRVGRDLGFATVERDRKIGDEITSALKKAYRKNRRIFGNPVTKFRIFVCDAEAGFRRKSGYYYQKWSTATVLRNCNLVTRSPEFVEKIGRWKRGDFRNIMDHELNHVFWKKLYHYIKPIWLMEGFACHVGKIFILNKGGLKQIIREYGVDSSILEYRYLKRNFNSGHYPRYPVWAGFTGYLVRRYSLKRVIGFMDRYSRKPLKGNYKRLFRQVFGKADKEIFREFLKEQVF